MIDYIIRHNPIYCGDTIRVFDLKNGVIAEMQMEAIRRNTTLTDMDIGKIAIRLAMQKYATGEFIIDVRDFYDLLDNFNWPDGVDKDEYSGYYDGLLQSIAKTSPELTDLYNKFSQYIYGGKAFGNTAKYPKPVLKGA